MRRPVQKLLVIMAAVVGLGLAGCVRSPANAISVNDTIISEDQVSKAAASFSDITEAAGMQRADGITARITMMAWLSDGALADQVSQTLDVPVDENEVEMVVRQLSGQYPFVTPSLDDPNTRDAMTGELRWMILRNQLDPELLEQTVQEFDVTVNPRYGRWLPNLMTFEGAVMLPGLGLTAPILPNLGE